jgi:hypothetical protein
MQVVAVSQIDLLQQMASLFVSNSVLLTAEVDQMCVQLLRNNPYCRVR